MSAKTYRYQLPKKAVKTDCPQCGPKYRRTLSRYVDSVTGEALPDEYGRCDRESNCGYHLSPYHKGASGLSYADVMNQHATLPKEWFKRAGQLKRNGLILTSVALQLQRTEGATAEQAERVATYVFETLSFSAPNKPTFIQTIPDAVFAQSIGHYNRNRFAWLLREHFGLGVADQLLHRFQIGTSNYWKSAGACVFWLIDEQGRKRGGQIKLFDDTFHTVKYVDREGRKRSRTSWVHTAIAHFYDQRQQPKPDWLTAYIQQGEFAPCLFGLPQLTTAPADQPIAIVEAPKTAVLCTPYFPQFVWMAVIGRSYLNAERLAPLKNRSIVLFPDLSTDGRDYAYWKGKADGLRQQGFKVMVSDRLEKLADEDERANGLDLADYLLDQWNQYPYSWDVNE